MRGHQPIIALRRRGLAPAMVQVDTDPDTLRMWRDWPGLCPALPFVQIDPADVAAALDLRFLAGLVVNVAGSDPDRVAAVAAACEQNDAQRVIAVCTGPLPDCHVITITDTEGVLSYGAASA